MNLYVCYRTWKRGPRTHPCGIAYEALKEAGHGPEEIRSHGAGPLPGIFNLTPGRREVKRPAGNYRVPVLVADDGPVVQDSKRIAEWAQVHPATAAQAEASAS